MISPGDVSLVGRSAIVTGSSGTSPASGAKSTSWSTMRAGTFYAHFFDTSTKGQAMLVDESFASATNFVRTSVPVMPMVDQ